MNSLRVFRFETSEVRTNIDEAGDIWFVAKDVCRVLGISNSRDAIQKLQTDDVGTTDTIDSIGRAVQAKTVNESGLYALIFRSRKEGALLFQRWVTKEVLPSIRKTGTYSTNRVEWLAARNQGKLVRQMVTDKIADFIEYAKSQGSSSAEMYYVNFSKMVNTALIEIEGVRPKNIRDSLNSVQLNTLSVAENIIARSLSECMAKRLPYKDSFQIAKSKIQAYADTVGKTRLGQSDRQCMGLLA